MNGSRVEVIEHFPFVLKLSKHEQAFFISLPVNRKKLNVTDVVDPNCCIAFSPIYLDNHERSKTQRTLQWAR